MADIENRITDKNRPRPDEQDNSPLQAGCADITNIKDKLSCLKHAAMDGGNQGAVKDHLRGLREKLREQLE
ncbi:MAG: hypothetical protein PHC51_08120 [bacterium]|nr:hypothetical protein [bacterium]